MVRPPEKIVTPQVKPEDANPYRYDDSPRSAYAMRERQRANDQLWAEQAAPVRAWLTEIVTHDNKDSSAENIEALMKVMRAKNVPFTRETVRRQFLDLWGVEMHADSRREAFTPDRIRLLSAAFRNHMHWSELIGGDVVISPPYKWQVLFNASDLRVMPRANRLPCRLA